MMSKKIPKTEELFDLSHTLAAPLIGECAYPEEALGRLGEFISDLSGRLGEGYREVAPGVLIATDATVEEGVRILPPAIIGHGTVLRQGAYLRGAVIIGDGAVVGNSSEIKNSIIFDGAQLPHYNYVGDSILGYGAHLGAGATVSNLRLDKRDVTIRAEDEERSTDRRKLGALIGDRAEIGCGAVLCPGSVIGRGSMIYPLSLVRGVIGGGMIFDGKTEREADR